MFGLSLLMSLTIFMSSHSEAFEPLKNISCTTLLIHESVKENSAYLDKELPNEEKIAEAADRMRNAGYYEMEFYTRYYAPRIPRGTKVAEFGPYRNPIGVMSHLLDHPYVGVDLDRRSLVEIDKTDRRAPEDRTLINVNLNNLTDSEFKNMMENAHVAPRSLGAVVMSSFLNYVDARQMLMRLAPYMADGGIIFITNSYDGSSMRHPLGISQMFNKAEAEILAKLNQNVDISKRLDAIEWEHRQAINVGIRNYLIQSLQGAGLNVDPLNADLPEKAEALNGKASGTVHRLILRVNHQQQ